MSLTAKHATGRWREAGELTGFWRTPAFGAFGVAGAGGFALCCGVRSFTRSTSHPQPAPRPVAPPTSPARPAPREPRREAEPRLPAAERNREIPVCGLAAVRALFQARPAALKRLFFDQAMGRRVGGMSGYMARERKVYRQVPGAELEKIAGTVHHGGIVAIIEQEPLRGPDDSDLAAWAKARKPIVLLDRIGNAHNLGAIVRTLAFFGVENLVVAAGAFFGVENLVVAAGETAARPGESTYRVAEGGMEHVKIWTATDFGRLCAALRTAGFAVVGTDVRGPNLASLRRDEFLPTGVRKRADSAAQIPVALVLGNEEAGLAPEVAKACDRLVRIPGSGQMESLNVSAAAAVLVAALTMGR